MGRWNKNRKPVGRILIMTEEGSPALVFDLENGKLNSNGPKIFGTPGYGQLNNNPIKNRTEKSSYKRGKQSYAPHTDNNNNNNIIAAQTLITTNSKQELDHTTYILQENHQKGNAFQQMPPTRSIYSPPPPPSSPNEIDRHFTLSASQNLSYTNQVPKFENSKNSTDIVISIQDAELEPIQFYTEDDVFDFEFLKQDDFLHITDMKPPFFDVDPLTGSLPEIDYI